jgi:hypothetical protein
MDTSVVTLMKIDVLVRIMDDAIGADGVHGDTARPSAVRVT